MRWKLNKQLNNVVFVNHIHYFYFNNNEFYAQFLQKLKNLPHLNTIFKKYVIFTW